MALEHIILLKLRENISEDEINQLNKEIESIKKNTTEGCLDISFGKNMIQDSMMNKGYNFAFSSKFADKKSLDRYLNDPSHISFKDHVFSLLCGDPIFVDYQSN